MERLFSAFVAIVTLQACASAAVQPSQPFVPVGECPVLLLTRTGGLGFESQSGVIAAVWQSGTILRAESPKRPWLHHVVGQLDIADATALLEAAKSSPIWNQDSGEVVLDMPDEELTLQRGDERRRWAETPGFTSTPYLSKFRAKLVGIRIGHPVRAAADFDWLWKCRP